MRSYLQILSSGTADCPPSVVLHFDSQRYMINCGEGIQRLCIESKFRYGKLKTVLLTRNHWDCIGGLPGMILTVSDVGIRNLRLLGPKNMIHSILSTRQFMYRHRMAVDAVEFDDSHDATGCQQYHDENLRITAVMIRPLEEPRKDALPLDQQDEIENNVYRKDALSTMFNLNQYTIVLERLRALKGQSTTVKKTATESTQTEDTVNDVGSGNDDNDTGGDSNNTAKRITSPDDGLDEIEVAARAISLEARQKMNTVRSADLPVTKPNPVAISYICQTPDYVGKFDKKAAMDLGVKPGAVFRDLVNGKSVLAADGTTWVHPHQVIQGSRPGRVFAVVDCPSIDYIPNLTQAPGFQKYFGESASATVACVVHLAGQTVITNPLYQDWMRKFGLDTQHIVAHTDYCGQAIVWRGQAQGCYKLSKLSSQIFPLPYYDNQPTYDLKDCGSNITAAEPSLIFTLEPETRFDRSEIQPPLELFQDVHASLATSKLHFLRDYCQLADQAKKNISQTLQEKDISIPGKDVVMTSLGTGSSHPSKYRNVSATLVSVPGHGGILLDVGEGTYGQLFRHFGRDEVCNRIRDLKMIFISHLHADHHLGIITIVDQWCKLQDPQSTRSLYLIAPTRFHKFLHELCSAQPFGYDRVKFINSHELLFPALPTADEPDTHNPLADLDCLSPQLSTSTQSSLDDLFKVSGISDICTAAVIHCPDSYGISITHQDGWKVVYSGDTRPTESLTLASQKTPVPVSVLLHEATFENEMQEDAIKKGHSTTKEAIEMGQQMGAKSTLLTHFSQRYPKIPQLGKGGEVGEVGICFDLMSVRFDQIWTLSKFIPALEALYSAQSEAAEEGTDNDPQDSS